MHQSQRADLGGDVGLDEHAAMAAGLGALRDDGIDAALGEKLRFAQGRGRADDLAARCLDARDKLRLRQAEMEAHHGGRQLFDHGTGRCGERHDRGFQRKLRHLGAKLGVIGRKALEPGGVARFVRRSRLVAEEVEIDRPVGARPDRGDTFSHLVVGEGGARKRAETAGIGDGDGHVDGGGVRHRRLHDGKLDAEQIEQSRVRPHDLPSSFSACACRAGAAAAR